MFDGNKPLHHQMPLTSQVESKGMVGGVGLYNSGELSFAADSLVVIDSQGDVVMQSSVPQKCEQHFFLVLRKRVEEHLAAKTPQKETLMQYLKSGKKQDQGTTYCTGEVSPNLFKRF